MTDLLMPGGSATTLKQLSEWEFTGMGMHPGGTNYVFVVKLEDPERLPSEDEDDDEGALYGIYKPSSGERPLRDFPYGTLHNRERASYLMSVALGWPNIPPTVIREGPHGEGSVQLFIDADQRANYFTLRDECLPVFEPIAMFDVLAHNADRKGGACLKSETDGTVWAIDHGLTFNSYARRRTVMFEFNGRGYPQNRLSDIENVMSDIEGGCSDFATEFRGLLYEQEVDGLLQRADRMVQTGRFPVLDPNVNVPWPFI